MPQKQTLKVLHVIYAMNHGGIESGLMNIYRRINRERVQFDFLINSAQPGDFDDEIVELGGHLIYAGKLCNPFAAYRIVNRHLQHTRYDAVHCHNTENVASVLLAALKHKIKVRIYHSHNIYTAKYLEASLLGKVFLEVNRRLGGGLASTLLAVSNIAGNSLFKAKKYKFVPMGVDPATFDPDKEKTATRNEFGFSDNDLIVGHVGRFCASKNHEFLLDILIRLRALDLRYKMLLIGNGELLNNVVAKSKALGVDEFVNFAGVRNDVPDILNNVCDVFVFPSRVEGLGLALVEAQAAGVPTVCSESVPIEAIVIDDLVTRISLEQTTDYWAEVIHSRLKTTSPYNKPEAYQKINKSLFNVDNTIRELMKVWQGV